MRSNRKTVPPGAAIIQILYLGSKGAFPRCPKMERGHFFLDESITPVVLYRMFSCSKRFLHRVSPSYRSSHSLLTPVECALAEIWQITPLESALPKSLDLKSFRMNTSAKTPGGGGGLPRQSRSPKPNPLHSFRSGRSPALFCAGSWLATRLL